MENKGKELLELKVKLADKLTSQILIGQPDDIRDLVEEIKDCEEKKGWEYLCKVVEDHGLTPIDSAVILTAFSKYLEDHKKNDYKVGISMNYKMLETDILAEFDENLRELIAQRLTTIPEEGFANGVLEPVSKFFKASIIKLRDER